VSIILVRRWRQWIEYCRTERNFNFQIKYIYFRDGVTITNKHWVTTVTVTTPYHLSTLNITPTKQTARRSLKTSPTHKTLARNANWLPGRRLGVCERAGACERWRQGSKECVRRTHATLAASTEIGNIPRKAIVPCSARTETRWQLVSKRVFNSCGATQSRQSSESHQRQKPPTNVQQRSGHEYASHSAHKPQPLHLQI
jgi:hypothetical protein